MPERATISQPTASDSTRRPDATPSPGGGEHRGTYSPVSAGRSNDMDIDPNVKAQVLRDAAAVRREKLGADAPDLHCDWCERHDGDCNGFSFDDSNTIADALDSMAAREEGRAHYLASQVRP